MKKNIVIIISSIIAIVLVILLVVGLLLFKGNNPNTDNITTPPTNSEDVNNNQSGSDNTNNPDNPNEDNKVHDYSALTDDYFKTPPFSATTTYEINGITFKDYDMPVSKYEFLNREAVTLVAVTDNVNGSDRLNSLIYSYVVSGNQSGNAYFDDIRNVIAESMEKIGYSDICTVTFELTNLNGISTTYNDFNDEIIQTLTNDDEYVVMFTASEIGKPTLSFFIAPLSQAGDVQLTIHYPND